MMSTANATCYQPVWREAAPTPKMLIADDQPDILAALRLLLKGEGFQTEAASSPAEALAAIAACDFDLVLMDLNYARDTTSGREGLDLLAQIRAIDATLPVVVMTAWGSIELAVEAMRGGGRDFVQKPWDNGHLLAVLRQQLALGRARRWRQQREAAREQAQRRELAEAHAIQCRLLPREIAQLDGCEIAAAWQPARAVGGDYFDVIKFDEHRIALCIADVMGKGMPAALLMANVQAAVRSVVTTDTQPHELCAQLNRLLCRNVEAGRFVTFFYCLLDTQTKKLTYANAGHNAPLLARRDGSSLSLSEGGLLLGWLPETAFTSGECELQAGDRLLLFTDGVTEATNAQDEEFGAARLEQFLLANRSLRASELQQAISKAVSEFSQGIIADDTTMIVAAL